MRGRRSAGTKRALRKMLTLMLMLALALTLGAACAEEAESAAVTAETPAEGETEAVASEGTSESGWREGMSPSKPYAGVPEVDLSERLGYMIFSPTKTRDVENSCQKLFVYLPRTDVKAGEGTLYLCEEESGEIWRTAMNDETSVEQRELKSAELKSLMWGSGTCFEITLPRSLELGKTYFVNMERGCIWTEDDKLDNPEVGGTDAWRFTVTGDYGVSGMEYRRALGYAEPEGEAAESAAPEATATPEPGSEEAEALEAAKLEAAMAVANGVTPEPTQGPEMQYESGIQHPESGDEIRFDLVLGGEATMAVTYGYNGTVDFPVMMFEQSGEVHGQVLTANPAWGVIFLDAQGNELHRVEFR